MKTLPGIVLEVGQKGVVDVSLEIGSVAENVTVTGQAPILSQASSDLGQVVNQAQVQTLPLNGRNFLQLALLTTGVNEGEASDWTGVQQYSANGLGGNKRIT